MPTNTSMLGILEYTYVAKHFPLREYLEKFGLLVLAYTKAKSFRGMSSTLSMDHVVHIEDTKR